MDQTQSIRESERAAVERWFPRSPLGRLFDPGDGRLVAIREDAVAEWRDQAFAIIDHFLTVSDRIRTLGWLVFGLAGLGAVFAGQQLHSGAAFGAGIGIGLAALHGIGIVRLRRYRRDMVALRARIKASLGAAAPLPVELGARYVRANHWRTALHAWVLAILVIASAGVHFLSPDQIPPAATLGVLASVAVAWGLYFMAQHRDRAQQSA